MYIHQHHNVCAVPHPHLTSQADNTKMYRLSPVIIFITFILSFVMS